MNPIDLPRIASVAATSLVCKMAEVVGVRYDVNSLVVEVRDLESDAHWQIAFPGVEGFRVLDEGDLGEFWGHVPALVIEVTAGGWWEQECSRTGFVGQWTKDVREYFVGGQNACVSVLSWSEPAITKGAPHSRHFCEK
ncbi:hypothetical protein ACM71F_26115 [Pseudomonas aeruginosa]|uniref:hypothetical protein n=1 Tax=Pseudomonas aeruginosa TaxID=287 RepID=UPI00106CE06E|nr:hypothetical protein [Pseudomonas aeruginosa]MBX5608935.1 hypothetical protein [Pseudomonas aeruginosa]MDU0595268.1 hypothetical protein [Pseudomonas aeruginosa]MDY1269302.1 hypothetical protein [Pseudomonas aeruginosa]HBO3797514.1 hypothetical protein [Pseudomonas aeruginosa]HBP0513634.1 hypothetical protein [Pseudomonas aeruginosa]